MLASAAIEFIDLGLTSLARYGTHQTRPESANGTRKPGFPGSRSAVGMEAGDASWCCRTILINRSNGWLGAASPRLCGGTSTYGAIGVLRHATDYWSTQEETINGRSHPVVDRMQAQTGTHQI